MRLQRNGYFKNKRDEDFDSIEDFINEALQTFLPANSPDQSSDDFDSSDNEDTEMVRYHTRSRQHQM